MILDNNLYYLVHKIYLDIFAVFHLNNIKMKNKYFRYGIVPAG